MIGFMREFLLPGPKSPPKLTQTTKTRFAPQLHMNCIFISTVLYILIDLTDYSLVPNVSMLKYFRMSGADKGYIAMFSRTNLFLAILRLNNKVIFNPTKALGKLGNIVAEKLRKHLSGCDNSIFLAVPDWYSDNFCRVPGLVQT
jgi:hypothetical protein